jgi:CheY-like chemotaxis protein
MLKTDKKRNLPKIMIVDDDTEHSKIIKDLLEKCDTPYEVICVSNGLECLELLDRFSFDNITLPNLILLDIMMPVMDGWTAYRHLHKNSTYKNIPIIFFSARKDYFAKRYEGLFGTDFIEKPYDVDDLFIKIRSIINH